MRAVFALASFTVVVSSGCVGAIGDGPQTGVTSGQCIGGAKPPTTRVRRLTKVEIQSSATVVFAQDPSAALSNLDADSQIGGGYSNSDQLVVSGSFANGLNLAAETIGAQFKSTVTQAAYGSSCYASDSGAEACAQTFIQTFGKKIFRRDITADDVTALMTVYTAGREVGIDGDAGDRFATGLSWIVRAMVQSPDFLYLTELGDPKVANGGKTTLVPSEIASALSYSILGMPPDDQLVAAAAQSQLATAEQRSAQALRLIAAYPDSWTQQMRQFVLQWLGINFSRPEWQKSTDALPLFSADLKAALQTETDLFVDDWLMSPGGPHLDVLLTTPSTFVNQVNAPLYGVTASGASFQKVDLDPAQRGGILTMAGFLGSTSHVAETSPVIRGKVIMQKFLCRNPPPPPPVVPPLPPVDQAAPTTTRARFAAHLTNPACSDCHSTFQPMGDAFEEYDALGMFRSDQNGYPIDSSGALVGATGGDQPVANAVELAKLLAHSPDTVDCFARQAFRFTIGHLETDYDQCSVAQVKQTLSTTELDVRQMISSIVSSNSFVVRTVSQ
jgi:hypothetical protein